MELSKNKADGVARTPWLVKCFETYFAPGQFVFDRSHLVDIKWRSDGYYCVMLFQIGEEFYGADVAGYDETFEVCDDSIDFDEASWKTVQVSRHTDGFTMKGEDQE